MRRSPATSMTNLSRRDALAGALGGMTVLTMAALVGCSDAVGSQARAADNANNADDADLLARFIASPSAHIPRRDAPYRLRRSLLLPPGRIITLDAETRIVWDGPANVGELIGVFEAGGDDTGLHVADGTATIECSRPSPGVYAAIMRGRRGFTVIGIEARDCMHVHVDSSARRYEAVDMAGSGRNTARDVRISGGGARFAAPQASGQAACLLAYVIGGHVDHVHYENVPHGIQWWGGDAGTEPRQNGARANPRKCRGLVIERASARHVQGAGIWGSMGQDITIRDCAIEECLDVGFDAEGCNAVTFERCHARNAHNGCFTTFSLCDGIRFIDCQGIVDRKDYPLFRVYNVTQSNADNRNITIQGGRFECLDRTGSGSMDTAMGPVQQLTITGATLVNTRIDTAFSNMRDTRIADNSLTFPIALDAAAAIRAGASKTVTGTASPPGGVVITNNRIRYTVATGSGQAIAIQLREDDFNSAAIDRIADNIISGPFAVGISVINATGNIGMVPRFDISGNRFDHLAGSARLLSIAQEGKVARRPDVRWDSQTRDGVAVSMARALG